MACFLALDQSTSATKALLFEQDGRLVGGESREHRQLYPRPGWVEHDAEEIWRNTLAALRALLERHPERIGDLACLSLTNQRETVVVFERGSGRPLHPAIVWQCRRGDALCSEQAQAGREAAMRARTGLRLDAYFSASKLTWLVRHRPDLRAKLLRGEALLGTIDAYLIYRLTGGEVFATDSTNASRTLLYDINRLAWDEELCAWWEVPLAALPEVRESAARFGETTLAGLLPRPLRIVGVMGDSQASLFAQRCFHPGMAKVTFGSGSSVLLHIGSLLRLSERGLVTALAWVLEGAPTYAFEGIIISSASTLAWLRDQLGLITDFAESERLARAVDDAGGVYLVPAFGGLGLPYWEPAARAAIVGLSAQSDRRHVTRAALESMAYQLRDVLDVMRGEAELPIHALRADGKPTENRFLMQCAADLAGVELRTARTSDCSALGAALMGMLGTGVYHSLDEIAGVALDGDTYLPSMAPERVQRLCAGWQRAVRQVLPQEDRR